MNNLQVLSDLTGIPEYRLAVDDKGEYITKACALKAMDIHAKNEVIAILEWMITRECAAPLTQGNLPLWFGEGIAGKISEELYEQFKQNK